MSDPGRDAVVGYVVDGDLDIAVITLNRPHRLNAVNGDLVVGLGVALRRALEDGVGAAVLIGAGTSFSAGHDLKEEYDESDDVALRRLQQIQDVTRAVRRAPFPVIAAVRGYALGAGCEFALCCDLVIAGRSAVFGFPEVEVGLAVTGGVSYLLPLAVGAARAKELVLLGRRLSAEEARELGLVNTVVDDDEVFARARALGAELAARPRTALALAKRLLDHAPAVGIDAAYELEVADSMILRSTDDAAGAAEAFRRSGRGTVAPRSGTGTQRGEPTVTET